MMEIWILFLIIDTDKRVEVHSQEFEGEFACRNAIEMLTSKEFARTSKFFDKRARAICIPKHIEEKED